MSLSQISARPSTAHMLLQASPTNSAKTQSDATIEIVKSANGIATNWGDAAKQVSGVAFTFTISQAVWEEAQKPQPQRAIVLSGIGGGEVVERFDSWEALEARIRTDRTMNDGQKTEWLNRVSQMKKSSLEADEYYKSDLFLGLKSGTLLPALKAATEKYLAEHAVDDDIYDTTNTEPYRFFSRNSDS
ncbi:hypothetical protein [Methylobacterium sp. Leaf99]|uniref:hypothetical protein n=1 Tax=Methylobacterium sp. Leaf99 TaxID=1736251 RepID=UPI000A518B3F|nr:hypothetical protein [Methylobacterium sp. Leaf99]